MVPGEVVSNVPSIESDEHAEEDPQDWHFLNFTREQLLGMDNEDFDKVRRASTQGRNVPLPLIQISGQRDSRAGGKTE